jgi:hypothetical protein
MGLLGARGDLFLLPATRPAARWALALVAVVACESVAYSGWCGGPQLVGVAHRAARLDAEPAASLDARYRRTCRAASSLAVWGLMVFFMVILRQVAVDRGAVSATSWSAVTGGRARRSLLPVHRSSARRRSRSA